LWLHSLKVAQLLRSSACLHTNQSQSYLNHLLNALDRVQKKSAQFTNHTKDSDWETLAQRRTIARLYELFKTYSGERAWKAIRDRLRRPYYLSRVEHVRKIRDTKQRRDVEMYSIANKTIKNWKRLSAEVLESFSSKPNIF